ncbi:MAG TPA: thioredoxin domain-containing protein [Candidatus Paceibacterota bacterium]
MPEQSSNQQNLSIPVAIVMAGALIAIALYLASGGTSSGTNTDTGTDAAITNAPAVNAADHILGNPDAPVKVVEYTDFECPFCKQFHTTMKTIMDEYGAKGQVAWVMRNFPLQQLHPNAPKLAEAAECVASVGGNDAYWKFIDSVFLQAPVGSFFDLTKLDSTVSGIGVNVQAFESCYQKGTFKDKIQKEFNDAVAAGGKGTPFSVVVTVGGENVPIPGALPYANIKSVIDQALENK